MDWIFWSGSSACNPMICRRIISVLTFNKGVLYRTKKFHPDYIYTTNFLDFWWADEIVALDISREATPENKKLFHEKLRQISKKCFVPLAAGGGIQSLSDVDELFRLGVDKIVMNTKAIETPKLIGEVAEKYGSQAVVVSIDAQRTDHGHRVYKNNGSVMTDWTPSEWAKEAVKHGAGEIMITSIKEDGSLNGYDHEICKEVVQSVSVPVLISGGAGNWRHFEDGLLNIGADAVCTTNIYHFTESSMLNAKDYLLKKNIPVRI